MLWLLVKRGVNVMQTLLGSLGSTAALTPPQTQLVGEQPWSKSGFAPEMKQDLGLQALAMFYLYPSPNSGSILNR